MTRLIVMTFLTCLSWLGQAATIQAIRVWPSPEGTRLVFDLNKSAEYRLFTLHNPERVVIDFTDTTLRFKPEKINWRDSPIHRIRHATQDKGMLRVVIDLKTALRTKSFTLNPNEQYGHRLVIDLSQKQRQAKNAAAPAISTTPKQRKFIVAIDAGHGGEDPGAIGRNRTREKDVVLAIAKKLGREMKATPWVSPVLIRRGDYYIGLRKRMALARKAHADLFLSIHADAFKNRSARGASVYVLSSHGASSEAARWLAERENRADLIGGVSLDDKDPLLASVLLDLSQTASSDASMIIAGQILGSMGKISKLHSRKVQKAGFAVLKSPDIPSILIETGFISNPAGEKNLSSRWFQKRMAKAIFSGVRPYFADKRRAQATLVRGFSKTSYIVARGDTLSGIAEKHGVSLKVLRQHNRLQSDILRIGQRLSIPVS